MKKIVVTVLGEDRPGIVHRVSKVLSDNLCNILEADQTILQTEFAGIFIASMPDGTSKEMVQERLDEELEPISITTFTKDFVAPETQTCVEAEPYVITLRGLDRVGIIPGVSGVIAGV